MKTYLAGPINGCTDEEMYRWRVDAMAILGVNNVIDPAARDYRDREGSEWFFLVSDDKRDIGNADVILANCWQPSVGTSMEIMYGYTLGKPIFAIAPPTMSPWIRYHARSLFETVQEALDAVLSYGLQSSDS